MIACPCGGDVLRYGRRTISVLELTSAGVARNRIDVNRYRCKTCGSVSRDGPPTMGDDVRDAIVMETLRDGVRPLVRRIGCDDRTIKKILAQWIADREGEHDVGEYAVLGFLRLQEATRSVILIYDPRDETVVDLVPEIEAFEDWLREHASELQIAVVGIDPQLTARLEIVLPNIRLAIPATITRGSLVSAARASIREIARRRTGNFRERESLVDLEDLELGSDDLEEVRLWAPAGKAIRRGLLHVMAGLRGDVPIRDAIASVLSTLRSTAPTSGLAHLLDTWKEAIVEGLHASWIDNACRQAQDILADIARWRPMAPPEIVKGVLLFGRHHSLEIVPAPTLAPFPHASTRTTVRTLADARDDMTAFWQSSDNIATASNMAQP